MDVEQKIREMWDKAVEDLDRDYVLGTLKWLKEHKPELYRQWDRLEQAADALADAARKDRVSIERFREALLSWWVVGKRAVRLAKNNLTFQEKKV